MNYTKYKTRSAYIFTMIKRMCLHFEITISGERNQITTIYISRMVQKMLLTALHIELQLSAWNWSIEFKRIPRNNWNQVSNQSKQFDSQYVEPL